MVNLYRPYGSLPWLQRFIELRSGMTIRPAVIAAALLLCGTAAALESFALNGYNRVATTSVEGDFEGADYDKPVELQNGMAFRFNSYHYSSAYSPKVEVFKKTFSVAELKALNVKNPTTPVTLYKLLIKDHVYPVFRLR